MATWPLSGLDSLPLPDEVLMPVCSPAYACSRWAARGTGAAGGVPAVRTTVESIPQSDPGAASGGAGCGRGFYEALSPPLQLHRLRRRDQRGLVLVSAWPWAAISWRGIWWPAASSSSRSIPPTIRDWAITCGETCWEFGDVPKAWSFCL